MMLGVFLLLICERELAILPLSLSNCENEGHKPNHNVVMTKVVNHSQYYLHLRINDSLWLVILACDALEFNFFLGLNDEFKVSIPLRSPQCENVIRMTKKWITK